MKKALHKLLEKYAYFVSHKIYFVLIIVILITGAAMYYQGKVKTVVQDNSDMLPDDIDVINSFNIIADKFGSSDGIMIAIQIDPEIINSTEPRDIRDHTIIEYIDVISKLAGKTENVISSSSVSDVIRLDSNGIIPKSNIEISNIITNNPMAMSYVSHDYTLSIIQIRLDEDYNENEIVTELEKIIENTEKPSGIKVNVAGSTATGPVIEKTIGPDMAKTSKFSMFGIIAVLFMVFFSIRYALTPLAVIGIGVIWTFGYFGLAQINLSSVSSGAISMIMGIGIDFGIQIVSRFRDELNNNTAEKAMEITILNVFIPMGTTTLAALIGFRAMSMGKLSVMQELASIMSYGVLFCFLAAITIVPVISIIGEHISNKFNNKSKNVKRKNTIKQTKRIGG